MHIIFIGCPVESNQIKMLIFFQDSSEVIALQDKLSQSNNKLAEFRNQCEKLKKDLKVAHKVLLKHVTAIYILLQC